MQKDRKDTARLTECNSLRYITKYYTSLYLFKSLEYTEQQQKSKTSEENVTYLDLLLATYVFCSMRERKRKKKQLSFNRVSFICNI